MPNGKGWIRLPNYQRTPTLHHKWCALLGYATLHYACSLWYWWSFNPLHSTRRLLQFRTEEVSPMWCVSLRKPELRCPCLHISCFPINNSRICFLNSGNLGSVCFHCTWKVLENVFKSGTVWVWGKLFFILTFLTEGFFSNFSGYATRFFITPSK